MRRSVSTGTTNCVYCHKLKIAQHAKFIDIDNSN